MVYAPAWKLAELATERGGTATAVLSSMAGSAVVTAAAHEHAVAAGRYPELVTHRGGAGSAFRPHGPRALPRIQAGADVPPIIELPYRLPIIDR